MVRTGAGGPGSVGVNGFTQLSGTAEVSGSWITGGSYQSAGGVIGDQLVALGNATWSGEMHITGDASVGGDVIGVGNTIVDGALRVGGQEQLIGGAQIASRGAYAAPAGPPCGCDPAQLFDVQAAVDAAAAAAGNHDSWQAAGTHEVHLANGSYFLTGAQTAGTNTVFVEGSVAVFVDGDLQAAGVNRWVMGANARLDLYVAGNAQNAGSLEMGDPAQPGALRLFVGGEDPVAIQLAGSSQLFGSIYAPQAQIQLAGGTTIVGALFGKTLQSAGTLTIEYGPNQDGSESCDNPPENPENPDADPTDDPVLF